MKLILTVLSVILFSLNSFATLGMSCTSGTGDNVTTMNIPQLPMDEEVISWTWANNLMFKGEWVKEYENKDQNDVSIKLVESWCDWNLLSHPQSCLVWAKMDLDGNGKFEAEFEVKGVLPASENPDEGTEYKGIMIDYTSGKKVKSPASCVVSM